MGGGFIGTSILIEGGQELGPFVGRVGGGGGFGWFGGFFGVEFECWVALVHCFREGNCLLLTPFAFRRL